MVPKVAVHWADSSTLNQPHPRPSKTTSPRRLLTIMCVVNLSASLAIMPTWFRSPILRVLDYLKPGEVAHPSQPLTILDRLPDAIKIIGEVNEGIPTYIIKRSMDYWSEAAEEKAHQLFGEALIKGVRLYRTVPRYENYNYV